MDRLFIWNILGGELENKGANSLWGEKKTTGFPPK